MKRYNLYRGKMTERPEGKYRLSEDVEKLEEQNKQLLDMIDAIPCTCDKIYKDRGLVAPDCPRCNYIDEDLIVTIENILKEGE
jgi:hypothetical protein